MLYAEGDLRLAKIGRADQDIFAGQIGFHAQQAAEKAIKAVLLTYDLDFPLTHDIDDLLTIARKSGLSVSMQIRQAGSLTPYAVEGRYPSKPGMSESDVPSAMRLAEQVVKWAKQMRKKRLRK